MKFLKSNLEINLKPSEMKILAEKYIKASEGQIEEYLKNNYLGEMGMPISCENGEMNITFSWKPEFDDKGNVTNY